MPYSANLGDSAGALASYRKALDIAEEVRARQPDNAATLLLIADLHDRTGWVEQTGRSASAMPSRITRQHE